MRELTIGEVDFVAGGGEVGDVAGAVAGTIGVGMAIAATPALPVVVVVVLGVACGIWIADELNDLN